jgi:hypothetical protein
VSYFPRVIVFSVIVAVVVVMVAFTNAKAVVSRDTEFLVPLMFGLIVQSSQRSILH